MPIKCFELRILFILASSIDNLGRKFLILVFDHLAKRVLDGRIVAVYEVTVDELNRQTRLADCPTADNGHFPLLGWRHLVAGFLMRSGGS